MHKQHQVKVTFILKYGSCGYIKNELSITVILMLSVGYGKWKWKKSVIHSLRSVGWYAREHNFDTFFLCVCVLQ